MIKIEYDSQFKNPRLLAAEEKARQYYKEHEMFLYQESRTMDQVRHREAYNALLADMEELRQTSELLPSRGQGWLFQVQQDEEGIWMGIVVDYEAKEMVVVPLQDIRPEEPAIERPKKPQERLCKEPSQDDHRQYITQEDWEGIQKTKATAATAVNPPRVPPVPKP